MLFRDGIRGIVLKQGKWIAYRKLTAADFFHTSKPQGHDSTGGGQSYIDLAGTGVSVDRWHQFFSSVEPVEMQGGPAWDIEVKSLGLAKNQKVRIAARKNQNGAIRNVRVSSQKIHSREANRIYAWHPEHTNFPDLPLGAQSSSDAEIVALVEDLFVYIIRTADDEYWAGYLKKGIDESIASKNLENIFTDKEGIVEFAQPILFDETISFPKYEIAPIEQVGKTKILKAKPAKVQSYKPKKDITLTEELFEGDLVDDSPKVKEITVLVRKRNKKAVSILKQLYQTCQITGDQYVFKKTNDEPYLEAHHLVPLGQGGADHPSNLVIISAHIHRMLHFAEVSEIDLSKISNGKLPILINGQKYEIKWKPEHEKLVNQVQVESTSESSQ